MIYRDTTAIEAVNMGRNTPDGFFRGSQLIAKSSWHNSGGYRGYTEVTPEQGYLLLDSDWTTGDYDDAIAAEHGTTPTEARLAKLEEQHGTIYVIYTPTSNVFSTGIDVLIRDPDTKPLKGKTIAGHTKRYDLPNGGWRLQYHATDVVTYNAATGKYTLNSGGWNTMTTADRMTKALPAGYYVCRRNWKLMVQIPGNDNLVELIDGMEV